jgi:hypothetical protein
MQPNAPPGFDKYQVPSARPAIFVYQSRYNQRTMTAMPDMTMATLASRSTKLSAS